MILLYKIMLLDKILLLYYHYTKSMFYILLSVGHYLLVFYNFICVLLIILTVGQKRECLPFNDDEVLSTRSTTTCGTDGSETTVHKRPNSLLASLFLTAVVAVSDFAATGDDCPTSSSLDLVLILLMSL